MEIIRVIKTGIKLFRGISVIKTIRFNLHYFPIKVAIQFPALIYNNVEFENLMGKIILPPKIKFGMLSFGKRGVSIFPSSIHSVWDLKGTLTFYGKCRFGSGFSLSVAKGGSLEVGDGVIMTAHSTIDCVNHIKIGNDCLLSWDILIMDSDYHKIEEKSGIHLNPSKDIIIGNHCWIGCRCLVLKGVKLADNVVVAANTTILSSVIENNCIVGECGKSLKYLKNNINWNK